MHCSLPPSSSVTFLSAAHPNLCSVALAPSPPTHSALSTRNLVGSLPVEIGAWVDIIHFDVEDNDLKGRLPTSMSEWRAIQVLLVYNNAFSGGQLPALSFEEIAADQCVIMDARATHSLTSFLCPWPPGATSNCRRVLATGHDVAITDSDCTPNVCNGSSTNLQQAQCDAWVNFYDSTGGSGWTYCAGTRTDPCSCQGYQDAQGPTCSADNTTVHQMWVALARMIARALAQWPLTYTPCLLPPVVHAARYLQATWRAHCHRASVPSSTWRAS